MWPSEGVYLYALRADSGSVVWQNRESATLYQKQPHPGSFALLGVAPQGCLLGHEGQLFLPTGRNVPAAFDRNSGKLQYYRSAPDGWGNRWGGTWNFLTGRLLVGWRNRHVPDLPVHIGEAEPQKDDGLVLFDTATGGKKLELPGKIRAVVDGEMLYASGMGKLGAYDFRAWLDGKGLNAKWETEQGRTYALIKAGKTLVAGGRGAVAVFSAGDGRKLWEAEAPGQVRSVAVADGRLLASTTEGEILCYGADPLASPPVHAQAVDAASFRNAAGAVEVKSRVQTILEAAGKRAGYCLVLGVGDGQLPYHLAQESELTVFCLEADAAKAAAARRALDAARLYGARVVVQDGVLQDTRYPDCFADLIVLDAPTQAELRKLPAAEVYRVLRPCGGRLYIGLQAPGRKAGGAFGRLKRGAPASVRVVSRWLKGGDVPDAEIRSSAASVQVVRGALPGSDDWTHQYGSAARTGSSNDRRVKWPLRMLWFGAPGPATIVSRHWQGPAPLYVNGRMFITGQKHISAADAYNGRALWRREFPAAGRWSMPGKGGNVAVDPESVFLASGNQCVRLAADTGETLRTYALPAVPDALPAELKPKLDTWSFLAVGEEAVFGSMGTSESAGVCLFALRKDMGKLRWSYAAAGTVPNNGVSVGADAVYLIERVSGADAAAAKRRGLDVAAGKRLVALDRKSGKALWTTTEHIAERTTLWLSQGVLVAIGGGGLTGYEAGSGKSLYSRRAGFRRSPVIVDDSIYIQPNAFDLRTGAPRVREDPFTGKESPWSFSKSYGCGTIGGAPNLLTFRSGTLGVYGLDGDTGVHNFPGVRAGCCINAIPAGGLLLMSPGDAGCSCSYCFQTTLALAPAYSRESWGVFYDRLPATRVERALLNLGAPGDRRDPQGRMWLGVPRPKTRTHRSDIGLPFRFTHPDRFGPYHHSTETTQIAGTDMPWVYASGLLGVRTAEMDLDIMERGYPAWPAGRAVSVDGVLDEPCWDGYKALNVAADDASVTFRYDKDNLYLGYKRRAGRDEKGGARPWKTGVRTADGPVWQDDSFEVFLSPVPANSKLAARKCLHLAVSASGARYDGLWTYVSAYGPRDIPELAVEIDGKTDDWRDKGLRVTSLPGQRGKMRAPADFDPCFRIGWNREGLLLLAEVTDNVVYEHPDVGRLFSGDSVEFFMAPQIGGKDHFQVVIAPGASEKRPKPRHRFYDRRRKAPGRPGLSATIAGGKAPGGYLVEALLPWKNFGIEPAAGVELGLQVFVNDNDQDKRRPFLALWHPGGHTERDPFAYQAFRLAAKPGAPIEFKRSAKPGGDGLYTAAPPHAFPLAVPPLGAKPESKSYEGVWQSAVQVSDAAFAAEVVIPWQTLAELGFAKTKVLLDPRSRGPLARAPQAGRGFEPLLLAPKTWQEERTFTVRLHFAEVADVKRGERVFDVRLQGETALKDFDVVKAARGRNKPVVKEFRGITAARALSIEFVPKVEAPTAASAPILSGVELLREE